MREIFLKTDNLIEGKYLAELSQEVFNDLESSKLFRNHDSNFTYFLGIKWQNIEYPFMESQGMNGIGLQSG